MSRQKRKHTMKFALKTETLEIYNALLSKTACKPHQDPGNTYRTQKNISVYEYLAIPTFVRHGKTIDAGY